MTAPKKILIVGDISYNPRKMFVDQIPKLTKGFIRLGHDVRLFGYGNVLMQMSPFKSRKFASRFYKKKADETLALHVQNYKPDIIQVCFSQCLNGDTIDKIRNESPNAVLIGGDGDPWPKYQRDRIEIAKHLDVFTSTNNGTFLADYRNAGVKNCVFMPNLCDPDIDHRYEVGEQWRSDILFTGQVKQHRKYPTDPMRHQIVNRLAKMKNCSIYGCLGHPNIGGLDYFYAISGAKMAVNVNVANDVSLYHSDRLTHYLACGTFVLAKRVPDSDLLFKDGVHIKYFDTEDDFFELADWYLKHESERLKIADAGMARAHSEFNGTKIAQYVLDIIEKGSYKAPWNS